MPTTAPHTAPARTITYNGRTLTPGEFFEPFPDRPDYSVRLDAVTATEVTLTDPYRTVTLPLDCIADCPGARA